MTMHTPLTLAVTARPLEVYRSTKTYDHTEGLSCCFRQWRATHSGTKRGCNIRLFEFKRGSQSRGLHENSCC